VIRLEGEDVAVRFFDTHERLAVLSKKGDPLEAIDAIVPWESFRADIESVALTVKTRRTFTPRPNKYNRLISRRKNGF
jgi:hypothetical protein